MMKLPLVSCIMPTADRAKFILHAITCFLNQDYPNTELIIFDDGKELVSELIPDHPFIRYYYTDTAQKIGPKRNFLCELALGEIIMHFDDDDWYAPDWISKQVNALFTYNAEITGISNINFFSFMENKQWNYKESLTQKTWVYGATLAYKKSLWNKNHFKNMQTGEDNDFIWSSKAKIYAHNYTNGYLGIIHNNNIGIKLFEDPKEKLQQEKWIKKIDKPQKHEIIKFKSLNSNLPLVSCIMPTANRSNFVISAIDLFKKQDYPNKELIIIDDGLTSMKDLIPLDLQISYFYHDPIGKIGTKRNFACKKAKGEFIMHWDDDDWYAPDWISYQLHSIIHSGADICGINQVQFFSPSLNTYWMTKNRNSKQPWLTGASLIYRKLFWEKNNFKDLQSGEDNEFIRNTNAKVYAHDYFQGFIATLHSKNTSSLFPKEILNQL